MFHISEVVQWLFGTTVAVVPHDGGYWLVDWTTGDKMYIK